MAELLQELLQFMWHRKKFWLAPVMVFLVLFGFLLVTTQGTVFAPFIYTLF